MYNKEGTHTFLIRCECSVNSTSFDLVRLYRINALGAFFIIREKGKPAYEIVDGESIQDGTDNVLKDQSIHDGKRSRRTLRMLENTR